MYIHLKGEYYQCHVDAVKGFKGVHGTIRLALGFGGRMRPELVDAAPPS